jgi:tetratricopeptide (TPR) repeat protein
MVDARFKGGNSGDGRLSPAETPTEAAPSTNPPARQSEHDAAFLLTEADRTPLPGVGEVTLPARFQLQKKLGSGGMGEVVLARDKVLDRDVAIKMLHTGQGDRAARDQLLHEAQAAAQIRHRHIVDIHDVDLEAGLIVMEYLPGGSGRTLLEHRGKLPVREVIPVARKICSALGAAHAAGLVHRDIKPDNVLFDHAGEVKIADFGVARSRRRTTSGSEIVGTPAYMAPEQLRGAAPDPRADIYALGLTIYELACGKRFHTPEGPAESSPSGLVRAVGSRSLSRVLARCLAQDPADRFATAAELDAALAGIEQRRHRIRLSIIAAVLFAGTALALALALPRGSEPAAGQLRIAALPFDNHSGEPQLEWLRQGFANLLSSSLRRRGVPTVRHEQMRDLAGNATDIAQWGQSALNAGASDLVSGRFERNGADLRVEATLRDRVFVAQGQAARADSLADELASGIAREVIGQPTTPQRRERSPEAVRLWDLGYSALQEHEFDKAVEMLREAIQLEPDYAEARYALITALSSRDAPPTVLVGDIDDALTRQLTPRWRALFEALRLRILRRFPEARDLYDRLVTQYPKEKEAHYGLAETLYHLGRVEQSMLVFKRLVKLAPGFHLAYRHPIDHYGTRGQAEKMIPFLYELRRTQPPPSFLALMETKLKIAQRDYPRALARAKSVGAAQPELLATIAGIQAILGDIDEARESYTQASALTPDNRSFRVSRAALDLTQGHLADFDGDAVWDRGSLTRVPVIAERLSTRGLLYATLGRIEEARKDLEVVRSMAGAEVQLTTPRLLLLESFVGWLGHDHESLSAAMKRMERMNRKEPNTVLPEIMPMLAGAMLGAKGDNAGAAKKFQEALRVREGAVYAPVLQVALARASLSRDRQTAAAACEDVLRPAALSFFRAAAVPPCLGILAQARDALGNREEARKHARTLLSLWRYARVEIAEIGPAHRIASGEKP